MDMTLIGKRIKERREALNMSAGELADLIGVHKATIFRYEAGDFKSAKLPIIEAIAGVLHVSPSWLIGKSDNMIPENPYVLASKDEKDVARIIDATSILLSQDELLLDGKPAAPESVRALLDAMTVGLELARKKNREVDNE